MVTSPASPTPRHYGGDPSRIVFEDVSFCLPHSTGGPAHPGAAKHQPDHRTGADRGLFGGDRCRQIDPGQPDSPLLRRHRGPHSDRRHRCARHGPRNLHQWVGIALQESVLFSGTVRDNVCYGKPEADRGGTGGRGGGGGCPQLHQRHPRGLRCPGGQAGHQLLWGATAADFHCPCPGGAAPDSDPRRQHQRPGYGHRSPGAGGRSKSDGRHHHLCGPADQHRPHRRSHLFTGGRGTGGRRHPRNCSAPAPSTKKFANPSWEECQA
jgi:hypothetical protein